ncbi:hypothetical protein GLOIN_2v1885672 [Rhizophagus clarus]|uniref:DUF659 domain-containing protein n=1 Tax=Rhizophagus clarus TaxID=94130 RepID=A0A8H3QH54_9GLOM|nr:hypothetical protein GLOIN_2v1885672 [Rhizophagus clarus]
MHRSVWKEASFADTISSQQSSEPSSHKIINRSSCYGPMDNFIVRSLSKEDFKKFYMLLLRLTLPDHLVLGGDILDKVVAESNDAMEIATKEDPVSVTLTFDGWTNVNNEQLLGTVLLTSEGNLMFVLDASAYGAAQYDVD